MLKITPRQMEAFEADFRLRRRLRYVAALRVCGWIDNGMPDSVVYRRVDAAIADAKSVVMNEEDDLVRFAALSFIPEAQRYDPTFSNRLGHVLTDVECEPAVRLDFIFRAFRLERFGAMPLPRPPYRR